MKLSECTTGKGIDVLCALSPYVINIVSDEELLKELRTTLSPQKTLTKAEWIALGAAKIAKIVPIVLKKRKNDVMGVLSVLNEKTVEDIEKQNIIVTAKQVRDVIRDKDLLDFFVSCADSEESE